MHYKRNLVFTVFVLVLGLLGVAAINFIVDPAGLFRVKTSKYEQGISEILLAQGNVANVANYDERLVQKYVIERSNIKRDILVLGSSRIMQIRAGLYPSQTFFNHGVSGATIEDCIAILGMYYSKKQLPSQVIIGLDPWLLNKHNGQNRWQSLKTEYTYALAAMKMVKYSDNSLLSYQNQYKKFAELISWPYLKESFSRYSKMNMQKIDYYRTSDKIGNYAIKLSDGSFSYPRHITNRSLEQSNREAIEYANSVPIYSLGDFTEIDDEKKKLFEGFIEFLHQNGCEVLLILPPYHPEVYKTLMSNPQYVIALSTEKYFKEFAYGRNISVLGSYDPNLCGISEMDFLDGMHLREHAIVKLLKS